VEPFAGSACLFWAVDPASATIADLNPELIECYTAVKESYSEVYEGYASLKNDADTYYDIRKMFSAETNPVKRAAYFIYLNRYCFNGLYRTCRQGKFNVPYGGHKTGSLPSLETLSSYSSRLSKATLICKDFSEVVDQVVKEDDFVYLDPPFYTASVRVFNSYTSTPFQSKDLDRFAAVLSLIDRRGARFAASYLDTPEIQKIASQWNRSEVSVLRRMSGFKAGRRSANELVFTNYDQAAQP
jgi:DNA adenine methylase